MSRSALGRRILPWLTSGNQQPPNHTEGRNPDSLSQHTSFTDGDPLLAAIHKEHTAGPAASIILTKLLQPIHAILSLYPGAPPNCFGRRLSSSSVRQPPFLAQIDPRQPQFIVGALCAQELPDGSEKIAAAHIKGFPYVVELFGRRQQVFQVQD